MSDFNLLIGIKVRHVQNSQCDLAALVYEPHEDPDRVLRGFASDLNGRGYRAVGLVQLGHHCVDAPTLTVMLVHSGEELQMFQDLGACAKGCRLDVGRLLVAARRSPRRSMRAPTS